MVTGKDDGVYQFRVYLPHAGNVELVGDFTEWSARRITMRHEPPGWWTATVCLAVGDHTFCYLVDGQLWMPDYAANGVKRNEYGNWVSQLAVPGRDAGAPDDAEPPVVRSRRRDRAIA
jgi:1,4-alpha-glucan branching enzyme